MIYIAEGIIKVDDYPKCLTTNDGVEVTVSESEMPNPIISFGNWDEYQIWGKENIKGFGIMDY